MTKIDLAAHVDSIEFPEDGEPFVVLSDGRVVPVVSTLDAEGDYTNIPNEIRVVVYGNSYEGFCCLRIDPEDVEEAVLH